MSPTEAPDSRGVLSQKLAATLLRASEARATRDHFLNGFIENLRLAKTDGELQQTSEQFFQAERNPTLSAGPDDASLITSRYKGEGIETHALLIDLDEEHVYLPSSTEGHGHLIVNVKLTRSGWQAAMRCLQEMGIHSPGYTNASLARGFASLRLPWVKKAKGEACS